MARRSERGLSLAEVLVAITVLALAMSIALVLYDGANRSFRVGDNLAEQQQVIRIAFDILNRDIRLAGLNTNPDGDRTRPDEQIEAAFDRAIVVRADFDANEPEWNVPEDDLTTGGAFLTVSTGNDEIVGYVLGRPPDDVRPSTGTLNFVADVAGVPRDGLQENVQITGVDLLQDDPPYTLYRVTVAADGSSTQKVPLVDNVRSLRFTYYDETGQVIAAPGGSDDPDGTSQELRGDIRRVGIEIEGLTRDRDLRWEDPDDTDEETRGFRKFLLAGDVVPRNLGRFGLKDLEAFASPPSEPPPPSLYPGHCQGLWMEWAPNPPQDEVARYEIWYGTDPDALVGPVYSVDSAVYLAGLNEGEQYYATVAAVDDSGDVSAPSDPGTAVVGNDVVYNRPEQPLNPAATTGLESVIQFSWETVQDNVYPGEPAADPMMPRMRDHRGYRLYRSDSDPSFLPSESTLIYESMDINASSFPDTDIVNCRTYAYRVTAVDYCGLESVPSDPVLGDATTLIAPEIPENVQAFRQTGSVSVTWDEVIRNVAGDPVHIEDYEVWRTAVQADGSPPGSFALIQTVYGQTNYVDPLVLGPTETAYYKVKALDDCLNTSGFSDTAEPTCTFNGTVLFQQPLNNAEVDESTWVQVEVDAPGAATYDLTLTFQHLSQPDQVVVPLGGPGPVWTTQWPPLAVAGGPWRIDAVVTQDNGCPQATSITVDRD